MNELLSLQDLFNKKIFRIPDYQRGYSWSSQQLNEFWEDIINLPLDRDHYTGMISLKKLNRNETDKWTEENWLFDTWGFNAYHVVDGQQRMTTFVILINEIVKFYRNLEENKNKTNDTIYISSIPLTKIIEDYLVIVKPDSEGQLKTYKFGYEVDNPSHEFFKHKILEEPNGGDIKETFYTLNLEKAKKHFADSLKELYEKGQISDIEKLYIKLTQRLKFNIYNINNDFNVFIAFETMNNRGKRLSNLELLKNRLIYLSTLFDNDEDVKSTIRTKINDTWKEVYGFLGKNKDKSLNDDEFLQAHWIIYFGYSRKAQNDYAQFLLKKHFTQKRVLEKISLEEDYEEIEETIDDESIVEVETSTEDVDSMPITSRTKMKIGDIGKYIDSMKSVIPFWYFLNFPNLSSFDSEIKMWIDRINRLGFVYFKPLTAVVLSKYESNKTDYNRGKVIEYLKATERYIFLHFRFSNYSSTYKNSYYYNKANELYFDKVKIEDLINEINKIDYLDSNSVINKDSASAIINNFMRLFRNYKGYYSWATVRYFLYEYECNLMGNQANVKIYPEDIFKKDEKDKVSIEHIYPQTANNQYWISYYGNYSQEEKNFLTGTLGNLLPLSMSINSQLQNDSFIDKKNRHPRGYSNGSHSEMEVSKNDNWTPEEILSRGLKMLDFMAERWDFKFRNEYDKVRFLGLDFMVSKPEEAIEEEVANEETEKYIFSKITPEMVHLVYNMSKMVYEKQIDLEKALDDMVDFGMNRSSASMYIDSFIKMMNGERYTRGTSVYAADYYIENINNDYEKQYAANAVNSLKKHIEYLASNGSKNNGLEGILQKYKHLIEIN